MAFPKWNWPSVPSSTEWAAQAWVIINQRLKGLENFLGGLTGYVLGRVETTSNADAPSVTGVRSLILRNTASTTISSFGGGEPGQVLVVLALDSVTTIQQGSGIKLTQSLDWAVINGETRQFYTPDGVLWYEVPRDLTGVALATLITAAGDDLVTAAGDLIEVEA